jgi:hypothetical protein
VTPFGAFCFSRSDSAALEISRESRESRERTQIPDEGWRLPKVCRLFHRGNSRISGQLDCSVWMSCFESKMSPRGYPWGGFLARVQLDHGRASCPSR